VWVHVLDGGPNSSRKVKLLRGNSQAHCNVCTYCLPAAAGEWTCAIAAARAEKKAMWPFAKLLWTLVILSTTSVVRADQLVGRVCLFVCLFVQ